MSEKNDIEKRRTANVESEYKTTPRQESSTIVVQKRKPSVVSSVLLVLIGAMIATIILLLVYEFKIKDRSVQAPEEPNTKVEEQKPEEPVIKLDLDIDGDFVKSLHNKIPIQVGGLEPYYSKETVAEDISDENRMLFVMRKLDNERNYSYIIDRYEVLDKLDYKVLDENIYDIKKYDFVKVEILYKSIYGFDKEVPLIDFDNNLGYAYEYCAEDSCFYGHTYYGGGGNHFDYRTTIQKVEKNEDATEIYIYDNIVIFDYDYNNRKLNETKFAMYGTSDAVIILEDNLTESNFEYNGKTKEELFEQYKGKGGNFKHTYKLDENGNYYWYSSEYLNN